MGTGHKAGPDKRVGREAVFQPEFLEDLRYWVETERRVALRALNLVEAILRDPFTGIGKPEPLKGNLSEFWSRRIDEKNRLVYRVINNVLEIVICREHY